MQLGHTLLEEAAGTAQSMLTTELPGDALSAAVSRAQPAADKLRVYQQQMSQLAATTQVDLTRVTEQHVQETSRTARALADDVTRTAGEDTEKNLRQQEETIRKARDAAGQEADRGARMGAQFKGNLQSGSDGTSGRPDGQAGQPGVPGNMQGSAAQAGNENPTRSGH